MVVIGMLGTGVKSDRMVEREPAASRPWRPAWLAREAERWQLWLPVAIGVGNVVYFAWPVEPAPAWSLGVLALAAIATAAWYGLRVEPRGLGAVLFGLLAAALGFAVSQWHVGELAGPRIERRLGPVTVSGRIVESERLARGHRVVLENPVVEGLEKPATPARIRLRVNGLTKPPRPGERLTVKAVLLPLSPPAMPGAFDGQWSGFFQRIGATGYAVGPVAAPEVAGPDVAWSIRLAAFRHDLQQRIEDVFDGDETGRARGAIAGALLTGIRGGIPDEALQAMRDSGLAHLLAISGMNIGLAAGFVFFVLRALLALIGPLALRVDIKKCATIVAAMVAALYLMISGAAVPAQRSFIMLAIVMVAVLAGRMAINMRTVAWAGALIILVAPESLLGASFQLSFSAVVALIAVYEWAAKRRAARLARADSRGVGERTWLQAAAFYVGLLMLTSLIATVATTPFGIYHFNRFPAYGVVANLLAVPVSSFWVMPWLLVAVLLMPFGLEAWALVPLGWGVDAILAVARTVQAWSGAVWTVPAMPGAGLGLIVLGGLWLAIWQQGWRWFGALGIVAGIASTLLVKPADLLLFGDGRLVAARAQDGGFWLSSEKSAAFVRDVWLRRSGGDVAGAWPKSGTSADGRLTCAGGRCLYRVGEVAVVLPLAEGKLHPDCAGAQIVVSQVPVRGADRRACRQAVLIVDRFDLWRQGGHAIWLDGKRIRIQTVNGERGNRPWVVLPRRAGEVRDGEIQVNSAAAIPPDGPES
ncbi:MAG: ComEC family competence protein [Alphaproteobacteria bacterium]|nr:ComEC family competence protein [Alphaproteobacteria bacterium]